MVIHLLLESSLDGVSLYFKCEKKMCSRELDLTCERRRNEKKPYKLRMKDKKRKDCSLMSKEMLGKMNKINWKRNEKRQKLNLKQLMKKKRKKKNFQMEREKPNISLLLNNKKTHHSRKNKKLHLRMKKKKKNSMKKKCQLSLMKTNPLLLSLKKW